MDPNELRELRELIEFLKANDIAEFDLEKGELKLRLKFMGAVKAEMAPASAGIDMAQLARLMGSAGAASSGVSRDQQVAPMHAAADPSGGCCCCAGRFGRGAAHV